MRYRSLRSYIRFIRPPGLWVRFALPVLFLCALASPVYSDQVTINFDGLADGTAITTQYAGVVFSPLAAPASSLFANNEGLSGVPGSSPNELIQVSSSSGISSVEILSAPSSSFAMDDVTYATSTTSIPEPSSLILAFAGCSVLIAFRKRSF